MSETGMSWSYMLLAQSNTDFVHVQGSGTAAETDSLRAELARVADLAPKITVMLS